jgi:hypothetical protein
MKGERKRDDIQEGRFGIGVALGAHIHRLVVAPLTTGTDLAQENIRRFQISVQNFLLVQVMDTRCYLKEDLQGGEGGKVSIGCPPPPTRQRAPTNLPDSTFGNATRALFLRLELGGGRGGGGERD